MLTLPNLITLFRIILVPVFLSLMLYGQTLEALVVFVVAGITDALDGFLARAWKAKSRLGAFLDPVADKLLLSSAVISLTLVGEVPLWATIILVSRDIILVLGVVLVNLFLLSSDSPHGFVPRPTVLGKVTTTLQLIWISALLIHRIWDGPIWPALLEGLFWCVVSLTLVSGVHYVLRELRALGPEGR